MFSCPHCFYVLTGKLHKHSDHGSTSCDIQCSHCQAILRVQITTLKEPNEKLLAEKGINEAGPPTTCCSKCGDTINLSEKNTHKCSVKDLQ